LLVQRARMADADGMCRPRQYQVFVFTQGQFAGSLSPTPMDSRTDGSLVETNLYQQGYLSASFNRYTPEDALCCPSASSLLFYQVETQQGWPVVVPQLPATTHPTAAGQ
ncbi:MAG TPA: LppP/LprE family lipoprotein, partial [Leptolyngbyaceae cyanobacterium M65_K2018_010]|nr:LppP/LprE family lipoprotein [Leptolyngbyaceae cyanobacterium M65_K2018_010]